MPTQRKRRLFSTQPNTSRCRVGALYPVALRYGVFAVTPALLGALILVVMVRNHAVGVDFAGHEWVAGRRILNGLSPYVNFHLYAHPALAAVLMAPLSLMPQATGAAVFVVVNAFAVVLTLGVLDVKDWRIYGPALLWVPVVSAWQTANITLILGLGLAFAWRHRNNAFVCGAVIAVIVSAKLFLWPLGLWLLGTRRYRAAGYALIVGLMANLTAWAILGFNQLARYLQLLQTYRADGEGRGYTLFALALHRGVSPSAAYVLGFAVVAVVGIACLSLGRLGRDQAAVALSVAICLLATPIVWLHYFALLIVPLAISAPRLNMLWGLPCALLFFGLPPTDPADWQVIGLFVVAAALLVPALRPKEVTFETPISGYRIDGPPAKGELMDIASAAHGEARLGHA